MSWQPSLGAWPDGDGTRFRVWAQNAQAVAVRIEGRDDHPMHAEADGYFTAHVGGVGVGARYRYVLDSAQAYPDPASRSQPDGVHGASEVVDPSRFSWNDSGWRGLALERLVTYELHVGTFTPEGTFEAAARALPRLAELGVAAVQLMPLADFPGERNWGYDGVSLFAPARCYGAPDDLRAFVDAAHQTGLGVILDVVYNHFGPDGAYHATFSAQYFTERHHSLWGAGINLDGPGSEAVRHFFIESAVHWVYEYHIDGFRLDATHALQDDSATHFLAEYAQRVHGNAPNGRRPILIAEDHRNLATLLQPAEAGGYGFDAVLADDFHHEMRRIVAGDHEGYYRDYRGSAADLATNLERGWLYTGEFSPFWEEPRGTDPSGLPLPQFVHCIQNHDQIGNRPFGDRLPETTSLAAYRAASAVMLCSAATPMLFMGQEWAASSPFQFFTDHNEELGRAVTEGRRREFGAWSIFEEPALREQIPDPQSEATFARSRLDWEEREAPVHASMLRLYQALLQLRSVDAALQWGAGAVQRATALDDDTVVLYRQSGAAAFAVVALLRGEERVLTAELESLPGIEGTAWELVLTTEDEEYTPSPLPVGVHIEDASVTCRFQRPGAVVLRNRQPSAGSR